MTNVIQLVSDGRPAVPMQPDDLQAYCDAMLAWTHEKHRSRADLLGLPEIRVLRDTIGIHVDNMGWNRSIVVTLTDTDEVRLLAVRT